jgi:hypothetical protein
METDDGGLPQQQHGGGEHGSAAPPGNVILTRGRLNTHLESIKSRVITVKQEPADYMDTDGGSGFDLTDEVFYIGGTGPFAKEDEGEGEEDDIRDDVSEKFWTAAAMMSHWLQRKNRYRLVPDPEQNVPLVMKWILTWVSPTVQ